jgi:transcriptional regulator with PAS, ATPase and Fis domain
LPVLILGETGVGKELLAKRIHERSARADGPFIATNCGTITESLAESILFGHERGAFTGAEQRRGGLFEASHGGTLFLDEVGELSLTNQARLLRVLEDKRITRVGGTEPIDVDVRVVAATHRDLEKMVRDAKFRRDLLYRIDVLHVTVPPLRERPADVLWLAVRFVAEHGRALSLDESALTLMRGHGWPGNVRELKNAIARACAMRSRDVLTAKDFELDRLSSGGSGPLHGHVADAEREAIEAALEACRGNQTRAARRLGISRRALIYKMEKHGLKALPPSKRYEPDGSK